MLSWAGMWIYRRYLQGEEKSGLEQQQIEGDSAHPASLVKISNSTVGGPVAGRDMSIGTYVRQITTVSEQQNDEYGERPTPAEIVGAIEKVPLFHQNSVADSYVGCKVRWRTKLVSIQPLPSPKEVIVIFMSEQLSVMISTIIRLSEYPLLRNLNHGEFVEVAGTISRVATGGDVQLKDVKLRFRDSAT